MDVRLLRCFLTVVDHGGVNKSAALHVAQPSLSQAISVLERDLGIDLFRRVGRRLVLTDAAHVLASTPGRTPDLGGTTSTVGFTMAVLDRVRAPRRRRPGGVRDRP